MPNYSAIWPIGTPPDIILHRSNCCLFCLLFVCVTVGTLLSTQYCQYWLCLKISTLSFHWKALSPGLSLSVVKNLLAKSPSDWCKISSDGVPIGSGTLAGDLGGITIRTPWSNGNWCDLEGQFWVAHWLAVELLREPIREQLKKSIIKSWTLGSQDLYFLNFFTCKWHV